MPFWDILGNTLSSTDFLRATSNTPFQVSSAWAQRPNEFREWQVELSFRIHGEHLVGGKGIAFWYTRDHGIDMLGTSSGSVMGVKDTFDGLGIWLDSSDEKNGRTLPVIMGHLNDGSKKYAQIQDATTNMIGGCFRDYRNAQNPTKLRISYVDKTLKVSTDASGQGKYWVDCFTIPGIELKTGSYFGISSVTSEKPDDHDIYSFETWEVNPPAKPKAAARPHEKDAIKREGEFQMTPEQQRRFDDVQRVVDKLIPKEHREASRDATIQYGQLKKNHDLLQERVENLSRMLAAGGGSGSGEGASAIEMQAIHQQINDIRSTMGSLTTTVQAIRSQLDTMSSHATTADSSISQLRNDVQHLANRIDHVDTNSRNLHSQTANRLQSVPGVAKIIFFIAISQVALLIGYTQYKKRHERNEKKFI